MSSTALEQQVEDAQAEHDEEQAQDDNGADDALFDKARYDDPELALPKVDGQGVDKIAIAFSGRVFLDRSDPRDVALMRSMKLGNDLTLNIEAKCSGKGNAFSTDKEGELDVIVLEHKAKVHTVYRPAGEEEA